MSVKHQIQKVVFDNIVDQMSEQHIQNNNIPRTRDEAKKWNKEERYIYSYRTAEKVMAVMNRVVKHSGVTDIRHLKKRHTKAYIKDQINKGLKKNTLLTERYGIRKFEKCLIARGLMSKYDDSIFPDIKIPEGSRLSPRGYYSKNEAEIIIDRIKSNYKDEIFLAVNLLNISGLRISELKDLKAKYINLRENKITVTDNIAKGGRSRTIPINKDDIGVLKSIVEGKDPEAKVISVSKRWIEKIIQKICNKENIKKRGAHGFRGKFANDRLKKYCHEHNIKYDIEHLRSDSIKRLTKDEKKVLILVSRDLGHNRVDIIRNHYLQR